MKILEINGIYIFYDVKNLVGLWILFLKDKRRKEMDKLKGVR